MAKPPVSALAAPTRAGGNPAHVPTDATRRRVRDLAKVFPGAKAGSIATMMGIARSTLYKHYREDMEHGEAEMLASCGAILIQFALTGSAKNPDSTPVSKEQIDVIKFILMKRSAWNSRLEIAPPPTAGDAVDDMLARLSDDQLDRYADLVAEMTAASTAAAIEEEAEDGDGERPTIQ